MNTTMRVTNWYFLAFMIVMLANAVIVNAQDIEKTPYYISINASDGHRVFEISDGTLSLQYSDSYGKWKEIPLKIYDWKRNLIATLNLDKSYGLNNFVIQLDAIYSGWELNSLYMCELRDESGRQYELPIKLIAATEKKPSINIVVNPVEAKCDNVTPTVVDFYGEITGGKAPYVINWFVMNNKRTDFLYQPKEEVIPTVGKTTVVRVDKNPSYYVALYVKDACGNIEKKVVNLVCDSNGKKISTIFVEDLDINHRLKRGIN